jgi:hypothetical protein
MREARRNHDSPGKERRNSTRAVETSGLLFIALLIFAGILVRYWHSIHWSWR